MFKKTSQYTEGGYARCTGRGYRIYKVMSHSDYGTVLQRLGDTNRGNFKFKMGTRIFVLNSRNKTWYEPVVPV